MIKIDVEIYYPSAKPLSNAEECRMAEAIRQVLQHSIASACCTVRRDASEVEYDSEYIRSVQLDIRPIIKVIKE